ncbi:MAG TPA: hypothetical protein PLA94_10305 [Myxococcota bacterium]|nr:hypothetical protein [Myxococcota bacterium]
MKYVHGLLSLVCLGLIAAFTALNMRFADPLPYSDEAAHLGKVLNLESVYRVQDRWGQLHELLFSRDPYPQVVHLVALAVRREWQTVDASRLSMSIFLLAHVALALGLGPRLWGKAGSWAYVALVAFSPIFLAYSRIFLIDVPLVSMVGAALILALASEGFSRTGPSIGLAIVATLGMLTKWVWAVFLFIPITLAILRAVYGCSERWGPRILAGVALILGSAGAGLAIWKGGLALDPRRYGAGTPEGWKPIMLVLGCFASLPVWAFLPWIRKKPLPRLVNVVWMLLFVVGTAGVWYTLMQTRLWERFALEEGQYMVRHGESSWRQSKVVLNALVPAGQVLLGVGLLGALRARAGGWTLLSGVGGAALGYWVIVSTLPFDPRYLIPLLPLLAAAVVAGWSGLGPLRWVATVGVVVLMMRLGVAPLWDPSAVTRLGMLGVSVKLDEWHDLSLPSITRAHPRIGKGPAVAAFVDQVRSLCKSIPCRISYVQAPEFSLQGRGLSALVGYAGTPLDVLETNKPVQGMPVLYSECKNRPAPLPETGTCLPTDELSSGCVVYFCTE